MHFYAEAPITSFFPRITASKKRKIHTECISLASVNDKRQRNHTSTTFRQGIKSKAEDEQERRSTLDTGTISILHSPSVEDLSTTRPAKSMRQQTNERHMPLLPSFNAKHPALQTPKPNGLQSRKKRKTSLQTPPPTNEGAERQRVIEPTPTLFPFISRKSPNFYIEKVLLPTPSTLGRSASHHNVHSGNYRCRVVRGHLSHQDSPSPTRLQYSDASLRPSVPVSIPSSQSQLMANVFFEDEHHLAPAGAALPCKKLQLLQYEAQPSPPNTIPLDRRYKGDLISHVSQMFTSSSQSQFLSPLDEHHPPQRSYPSSNASNLELDIIPSSQSQEKELRISSDPEECHQPIRSRKQGLPQRTFSDELFSVSMLQTGWLNDSLDAEQPIQGTADIPCVANHGDNSATESETDLASLSEDSEHKNSRQSSQYLSLSDQTSSFASLPSAVKAFQSMFGSDDESYPPDFPMSLR